MATFLNKSQMDQLLFVFASGAQDAMPTISDDSAIRRFIKRFGHMCEDCTEDSLRARLIRTRTAYNDTLKSK
jgi:hypothetical protein